MHKTLICQIIVLTIIAKCNTSLTPKIINEPIPNIIIDDKTDWGGNFKLHIEDKYSTDSSYVYILNGVDKGKTVGFKLAVPILIKKFGEGVSFFSLCEISNNFMNTLYSVYGLQLQDNLIFTNRVTCKYSGLNDLPIKGDGQRRLKSINYIKLFFESSTGDEYAELYLNIDEVNKVVEFEEKDFEYRPYIAYFLTQDRRDAYNTCIGISTADEKRFIDYFTEERLFRRQ